MKAVPQIGIVLGNETKAEGRAFTDRSDSTPIGVVQIEVDGLGWLSLSSTSPAALRAVEAAFCGARWDLQQLIREKASARVNTAPGADALDEAASATAAAGERPDDTVITGSAFYPRTGDPVAAPPSNLKDGAL